MATVIDVQNFRNMFPNFTELLYPSDRVQYWLGQFEVQFPSKTWGQFRERGMNLYTAHNLSIESKLLLDNGDTLNRGQLTVDHKEVGPLYKTQSYTGKFTTLEGVGDYAITLYGQMFYRLLRQIGIGVIYV